MSRGEPNALVLLNLSATFDTTSYLTDHYQSIFGVPQGSIRGPLLFSLYTTPLSVIEYKGIKFHFYADDSQLYVHLSQKNTSAAFEQLNRCLNDVKEWMLTSKLKLNPDKTEFIVFGLKRQRDKLKACFPIDILGSLFCPVDSVKNLGVVRFRFFLVQACSECLQKLFCETP